MNWLDLATKLLLKNGFSGQPTLGGSISEPITSTGYSVAADVAARVALLTQLQMDAIARFPAIGDTTFCNFGLMHVADGMGCRDLDNMNATCIVRHAQLLCATNPAEWREDSWDRAHAHAMNGGFGFFGIEAPLGKAHGHVASVAARPMVYGPSWGLMEPWIANVGHAPNDFKLISACFLSAQRPMLKCFLWRST